MQTSEKAAILKRWQNLTKDDNPEEGELE